MRVLGNRLLADGREFVKGRFTGIGRVLEGLIRALVESSLVGEILLATHQAEAVPPGLKKLEKVKLRQIPAGFLKSEKALRDLSGEDVALYVSPYPKLPLRGCHCRSVHIVHDVLNLTHPAYKRRFKVIFDRLRLRLALRRADLTWYDSLWSMEETKKLAGFTGRNPRVRYPGIDERFAPEKDENEENVLKNHDLQPGYVLVIGNGLPHKNLGVLLKVSNDLSRKLAFVGVSKINQGHWRKLHPAAKAQWIPYVGEDDLPSIIRGAFCLAHPSTAEGYGYPPLEAMACGVPSVVSNIPVLVETTGGNALVADVDDPKTWLEAFEALTKKEKYLIQIERGQRWVKPFFGRKGWEKHILDIQGLLTGPQA